MDRAIESASAADPFANAAPPVSADEPATSDALLLEFLRSRGGKCPRCEYDLTGLTDGRCPECGCAPRLTIEATDTGMRAFLWGLAPLVGIAGFYDGVLLILLVAIMRWGWTSLQPTMSWSDAGLLGAALVANAVACAWIWKRRRIRRLHADRRRTVAALAWLVAALEFAGSTALLSP